MTHLSWSMPLPVVKSKIWWSALHDKDEADESRGTTILSRICYTRLHLKPQVEEAC